MDKSIKISIITVVYNAVNTMEQTIKSVIKQKTESVEYIVIDGMSTDGTYDLIQKYIEYIDFFVHEKDEGLYYALNKGIMLASGDIIGIIHSDDFYTDTAVSQVVSCFDTQDADIVYGNALWFDENGKISLYSCANIEELWCRMAMPHPAVFVRKAAYLDHGLFDTKYAIAADYELMLRMYSEHAKFVHLDEILAYFRKGGLSFQRQDECIEEAREISLCYIHRYSEQNRWIQKIEEIYAMRKFESLCEHNERFLSEDILSFLQVKDGRIAIFGVGEWGKRCLRILKKANIKIDFFVDNNPSMWGENIQNIFISSPEKLTSYHGSVLIATYNYGNEIKEQLKNLNSNIVIFSVLDWAKNVAEELYKAKYSGSFPTISK